MTGRQGSGGGSASPGDGGGDWRRRVGAVVAAVPAALFAAAVAFVALRPAGGGDACRHDYAAERVRDWWREARRAEVSVPGARYVAFDDSAGCIYVGLEDAGARTHLERRFRRLGVPRDVVVYEERPGDGRTGVRPRPTDGAAEDAPPDAPREGATQPRGTPDGGGSGEDGP